MKKRLRDVLDHVDEADLVKMQKDIESGGLHLGELIKYKLKERQKYKEQACANCGKDLTFNEKSYTLLFGREDFKKKASFCELDCLEFFIGKLKAK